MEKIYVFVDKVGYWTGPYTVEEINNSCNRYQDGWAECTSTLEEIAAHNLAVAQRFNNTINTKIEDIYMYSDCYGYWTGPYTVEEINNSCNRYQDGWFKIRGDITGAEIAAHNRRIASDL